MFRAVVSEHARKVRVLTVEELAIEPFYPATAAGAAPRSNPPVLTSPASSRCMELNPLPR
jgi:hypothetical protein